MLYFLSNFRSNQNNYYRQNIRYRLYLSSVILPALIAITTLNVQAKTPVKSAVTNKSVTSSIKQITDITTYVQRDWRSDDGQFFLTLYSAIWNPHGTLFYLKKRGGVSVEGFQKGLDFKLKSYDPEVGLEAPPEYAITGTLNQRTNILVGMVTHYPEGQASVRKTIFTPAIPITAYPQYDFKYYGTEDPNWHRATITRVDVINKDTKAVVQQLTGFRAQAYSTNYADMNYDGYFDLVLQLGDDVSDDTYLYWLYDPASKKFVRNKTLEAISGHPSRYLHKKQLHLNKDALLERVNGQWIKRPCCYAD